MPASSPGIKLRKAFRFLSVSSPGFFLLTSLYLSKEDSGNFTPAQTPSVMGTLDTVKFLLDAV